MMTPWDMWNHQNKALHELDANWHEILEEVVNQQIQQAYAQGTCQLPIDAKFFMKRSLTRLLKFPVQYKHQWLASVMEAAQAWFIHQSESQSQTKKWSMTQHLCRMANL